MSCLFPKQRLDGGFLFPGKLADGMDSEILQPFLGGFAQKQKIPDGKGPHFDRNFFWKQGVHLVRLLEIRSHFGKQLIGGNPHIHSEAKLCVDLVLDLMGGCNGIRVDQGGACHIQEHFVNGKGFHHRGIVPANRLKCQGILCIKAKITGNHHKIGAFPKSHGHRLPGLNAVLLGGNGFGNHDSRALLWISAHH